METGSRAQRTRGKVVAGRPSEVADCGAEQAKLQLASEAAAGGPADRPCNPEFQSREIKPQTSDENPLGVEEAAGETPSLTGEFVGETHRGLERTQAHPLGNQH